MRCSHVALMAVLVCAPLVSVLPAQAQGTVADYQRAMGLRDKYQGLSPNIPEPATWIEKTPRFWYRKSVKGGNEFVLVDATTQVKQPAFDHEKMAAALTSALTPEKPYTGVTLPFATFNFVDGERAIEITVANVAWKCTLEDYRCRTDPPGGRGGAAAAADAAAAALEGRSGPSLTSTASRRRSHPTASSRRSSTTTTSPSAKPASRR